jgi:ATP-binding cassette subfamily B protein
VEQEEVHIKEYDWHLMKRLLVYLKPYKWRVIAAFFLLIFSAALTIFTPFLVKIAVDQYIAHRDLAGLNMI